MTSNTGIVVTKYRESLLIIRAYLLRFIICSLRQANLALFICSLYVYIHLQNTF